MAEYSARDFRALLDPIDLIADPIERLEALEDVRSIIADLLTTIYERACWDARAADRDEEALEVGQFSRAAFNDYSRRWNGRLDWAERIRWGDPLHPHRRKKVLDLTEVAKGESPRSVVARRRERDPQPPQ